MEKITLEHGFLSLRADICERNARSLNILREKYAATSSELIRRAIFSYSYSMMQYEKGGFVQTVTQSGVEYIPLFDSASDMETSSRTVGLSAIITEELAYMLHHLGLQENGGNTKIMDNIMNHFAIIERHRSHNQPVQVVDAKGTVHPLEP